MASLFSVSTRRARGRPIRTTNCSKIAGRIQNAWIPETSWLASTRWMPWLRPRRARSSSSCTAWLVTASRSPNRYWNSSITATIRGQVPCGSAVAQLLELGDLVGLGRLGPLPHHLGEVLQQRQPELPVGVDVDTDQAGVRQPAFAAGGELGERHTLLEVEQVELQLVRRVAGGQRADHGQQQVRLAGPARAADQHVRGHVGEQQFPGVAVDEPDRCAERLARVPRLVTLFGRSRSNVAARVRHLSCSSATARQASITSLRGSGGSGTTVT